MRNSGTLAGCVFAFFMSAALAQAPAPEKAPRPSSEIPMYGNPDKPKNLSRSDKAFLDSLEKAGHSREEVAKDMMYEGWRAFQKGDQRVAIRKFNQAWLLDQENPNAYHGFAVIAWMRDKAPAQAEKFFAMALSKPGVNVEAHVDFGRFLLSEKRYDESIAVLKKALEISPEARGARSNLSLGYFRKRDYGQACDWAMAAKEKQEALPAGHLQDACLQAGKAVKLSRLH